MYMYRYIYRFLKQCGALIRVALAAEALRADGRISLVKKNPIFSLDFQPF